MSALTEAEFLDEIDLLTFELPPGRHS